MFTQYQYNSPQTPSLSRLADPRPDVAGGSPWGHPIISPCPGKGRCRPIVPGPEKVQKFMVQEPTTPVKVVGNISAIMGAIPHLLPLDPPMMRFLHPLQYHFYTSILTSDCKQKSSGAIGCKIVHQNSCVYFTKISTFLRRKFPRRHHSCILELNPISTSWTSFLYLHLDPLLFLSIISRISQGNCTFSPVCTTMLFASSLPSVPDSYIYIYSYFYVPLQEFLMRTWL